jgi:hypothetical protein
MTARMATANRVAITFRAAERRMLSDRFTKSNLPAALIEAQLIAARCIFEN